MGPGRRAACGSAAGWVGRVICGQLFIFGSSPDDRFGYLSLDTTVTILDGPDAPDLNVQLFTVMQQPMNPPEGSLFSNGEPLTLQDFRRAMVTEERLIYQFEVTGSYGMY